MSLVSVENLRNICINILEKIHVPREDSEIIADSIVYAHRRDKHTHGIGRMPIYARKIKEDLLNNNPSYEITKDAPVISVLDAENGFGQVAGIKAMDLAVEKAKKFGVGIVGVKDSNNFGTAGFISEHGVKSNMIGVVLSNSGPAIAPTGGKSPVFGTNPISIAYPEIEGEFPIVFDMACSEVARGKIRLAGKNNEKIPFGWALDEDGKDTDDPEEAIKGTMIPIGGHKGYGLAMSVDILAGLLTGSAFGGDVNNLNHPTDISRYGHMVIALNPEYFISKSEYEKKMKVLYDNVKNSGGKEEVLLPGENSYRLKEENKLNVEIGDNLINGLNKLAKDVGLEERLVSN